MRVTVSGIDGPTGLARIAGELEHGAQAAQAEVRQVVLRGAVNAKKDWRRAWTGLSNAPALQYAVGFDIRSTRAEVVAEIGPDKDKRQGALGNLLEYGSVNNSPHPGGAPALRAEEPRLLRALEDLAVRLADGER